jgi:hypothetical protein
MDRTTMRAIVTQVDISSHVELRTKFPDAFWGRGAHLADLKDALYFEGRFTCTMKAPPTEETP